MIFNCYDMIAYLSQAMTLEPGDVITTGTPSGVGVKMQPRGYMKPGQTTVNSFYPEKPVPVRVH
jgi:2-keto-4-pentenoate hydratase/2-oxohepta-3-ene-1,7-dioic acid hydratase in catechol pathway